MRIEEVKENLFPIIKSINGVSDVYVNDYDSETMMFCIDIDRDIILKDLRPISGEIRKKLTKLGISSKSGNLLSWEAPRKYKDSWGDMSIETDYFMVDFCYAYTDLNFEREFFNEYHIFDKYDYLGNNDSNLEKIFRDSYDNFSNVHDHVSYMEARFEFADEYNVYPIYKYEHSGIVYEASPSCRWDSGVVGVVAIEKSSKLTVDDIINDINIAIEDYSYA